MKKISSCLTCSSCGSCSAHNVLSHSVYCKKTRDIHSSRHTITHCHFNSSRLGLISFNNINVVFWKSPPVEAEFWQMVKKEEKSSLGGKIVFAIVHYTYSQYISLN